MSKLKLVEVKRGDHVARFNGTWYRGAQANFIPSKAQLAEPEAAEKFILPGWLPSSPFLNKQTAITAFGSCFAAHISEYLADLGFNIFGRNLDLDAHIIRFGEGIVNSFAIRQQLEWALGERDFPQNIWFGPDKEIAAVTPEIRAQTHDLINATEVFILTLGLSEIWYDKQTGDAFWRAIPEQIFDPERHGFRLSSVQENYENLEAIVRLVQKANPSAKIIFTLSPIPLMATFRPVSCLTANSVSKAILRVAIDQLMQNHVGEQGLFYFPSYELATELFPEPRLPDNRHIRPEIVQFIMETFCRHYCAD